ncbi:YpfB family protein [Bacillus sp. S14(2024)]|uniref:YpfB family protein n=1 Tax=Bacillus sp. S14(2024) TaxID=3162884 RepID=UPI003D1FF6E3
MKKIEKILIRILIVQCLCLCIVQLLLTQDHIAKYLSKVVYYEGVTKGVMTKILEVNE